jgi:hypothetical protein
MTDSTPQRALRFFGLGVRMAFWRSPALVMPERLSAAGCSTLNV